MASFESFINTWFTPTTMMAVLGGIIWGVQLNYAVIQQHSDISALKEVISEQVRVNTEQTLQLSRIAILIDVIEERQRTQNRTQREELERLEARTNSRHPSTS